MDNKHELKSETENHLDNAKAYDILCEHYIFKLVFIFILAINHKFKEMVAHRIIPAILYRYHALGAVAMICRHFSFWGILKHPQVQPVRTVFSEND